MRYVAPPFYNERKGNIMFRKGKRKIDSLIFVLPTFAAFIIGFIYPFFNGVYLSFCEFRTTSDAVFIGVDNYIKAFQNEGFLHSFWFTVMFVIVSVVLINVIAFFVAYRCMQVYKHLCTPTLFLFRFVLF